MQMTARATKMRFVSISTPHCCSRWRISLDPQLDAVKRIVQQADAQAQEIGRHAA
jgi:hypothetical protein